MPNRLKENQIKPCTCSLMWWIRKYGGAHFRWTLLRRISVKDKVILNSSICTKLINYYHYTPSRGRCSSAQSHILKLPHSGSLTFGKLKDPSRRSVPLPEMIFHKISTILLGEVPFLPCSFRPVGAKWHTSEKLPRSCSSVVSPCQPVPLCLLCWNLNPVTWLLFFRVSREFYMFSFAFAFCNLWTVNSQVGR